MKTGCILIRFSMMDKMFFRTEPAGSHFKQLEKVQTFVIVLYGRASTNQINNVESMVNCCISQQRKHLFNQQKCFCSSPGDVIIIRINSVGRITVSDHHANTEAFSKMSKQVTFKEVKLACFWLPVVDVS